MLLLAEGCRTPESGPASKVGGEEVGRQSAPETPTAHPWEALRLSVLPDSAPNTCEQESAEDGFARCLLDLRFAEDGEALQIAKRLYAEHGVLSASEPPRIFEDDGMRGEVPVEPALPIGEERKHLEWFTQSLGVLDSVLAKIQAANTGALIFFPKPKVVKFFQTPSGATPSAYVVRDDIAYNIRGELWASPDSTFETIAHELFHIADGQRGDWSTRVLLPTYRAIVERCALSQDANCLDRYAPLETKIDGAYYAFHPNNPVFEYGAELAARFLREHRALLENRPLSAKSAFHCQAPENDVVWKQLANEFFGGVDLTPPCEPEEPAPIESP